MRTAGEGRAPRRCREWRGTWPAPSLPCATCGNGGSGGCGRASMVTLACARPTAAPLHGDARGRGRQTGWRRAGGGGVSGSCPPALCSFYSASPPAPARKDAHRTSGLSSCTCLAEHRLTLRRRISSSRGGSGAPAAGTVRRSGPTRPSDVRRGGSVLFRRRR